MAFTVLKPPMFIHKDLMSGRSRYCRLYQAISQKPPEYQRDLIASLLAAGLWFSEGFYTEGQDYNYKVAASEISTEDYKLAVNGLHFLSHHVWKDKLPSGTLDVYRLHDLGIEASRMIPSVGSECSVRPHKSYLSFSEVSELNVEDRNPGQMDVLLKCSIPASSVIWTPQIYEASTADGPATFKGFMSMVLTIRPKDLLAADASQITDDEFAAHLVYAIRQVNSSVIPDEREVVAYVGTKPFKATIAAYFD